MRTVRFIVVCRPGSITAVGNSKLAAMLTVRRGA